MRAAFPLLLIFAALMGGCGDGDEDIASQVTGGAGGDPTTEGPLETPVLEAVIPMAKVLRVRWSVASPCDDIDGERRTDAITFAPAFTVPGSDTDFVDEDANANESYTYRVRCVRGNAASAWSNLLSGNPFLE